MRGSLTILGSGTSTGVPTLGCGCAVCTSTDPRDQRLRPSVWLRWGDQNVVFDTGPDFRTQALRAGIRRLDAVFFTHSHADHIMGMDDVRPFNFGRTEPLPIYANAGTLADIQRVFQYVFAANYGVSAIPRVAAQVIASTVAVGAVGFEPLPVLHGALPILGYRFGANAYVTDVSSIPETTLERMRGLDVLVLDALRLRPHPTHFHLARALEVVAELRPARTYFTHIAHELPHAATDAALPPGVHLAYDGLEVEVEL